MKAIRLFQHSSFLALASLATAGLTLPGFAEGTETLGAPSIAIGDGTDMIIAGVGLVNGQPDILDISIPAGASIVQVIAYWEGIALSPGEQGDTDTILIDGVPIVGERIGGVTHIINLNYTSTYRRDITDLGLVVPGDNSLVVEDLDFLKLNDGVGLAVIIDDGSEASTEISVRDGNDYAFEDFAAPLNDTVLQTFTFDSSSEDRDAELSIMLAHVSDFRSSVVEIWIDGVLTEELLDVIGNLDGAEWDTLTHPITVPAGATSVAIRPVSRDSVTGPKAGNGTASVTWVFAGFELTTPAEEANHDEGCSPWLWALCPHIWDGVGHDETSNIHFWTRFNDIVALPRWRTGMCDDDTLMKALWFQGGWYWWQRILNRHTAAALANADSGLDYPFSVDEVVAIYRDALGVDPGPETVKSAIYKFAAANYWLDCPLY